MSDINKRVKELFEKSENEENKGKYECLICHVFIKMESVTNLKDHLCSKHPNQAAELNLVKRTRKKVNDAQNEPTVTPNKRINLSVNINDTIREVVKFILTRGVSISCADSLGQKELLGQIFSQFSLTLNRHTLRQYIMKAIEQIYVLIADDVKDKLISLSFDGATRYNRHVFCTAIRYIKSGVIVDRTVGVITQFDRQSGLHLENQLKKILELIKKSPDDVLALCSDNGTNMIKASKIFVESQRQIPVLHSVMSQDEIEEIDSILAEIELEEEGDETELEESQISEDILDDDSNTVQIIERLEHLGCIVPCGSHTLQLSVNDVVKHFSNELKILQQFAKKSHSLVYIQHFKDIKKPRHFNETRWSGKYLMVEDFYLNKEKYKQITAKEFKLSTSIWSFIEEFYHAFSHIQKLTLELQNPSFTPSDCIIKWLKTELELSKLPEGTNQIPFLLLTQMRLKRKRYFENEGVLGCLALDPRINWTSDSDLFNATNLEKAVNFLFKTHEQLKLKSSVGEELSLSQSLTQQVETTQSLTQQEELLSQSTIQSTPTHNFDNDLVTMLGGSRNRANHSTDIKNKIRSFVYGEKVSNITDFNLIKYWKNKKSDMDLHAISQQALAIPFSQAKVERQFSLFAIVLSPRRTRTSSDLLNALLVLQDNVDLIDKIKFI